jgi:hypothetical protein
MPELVLGEKPAVKNSIEQISSHKVKIPWNQIPLTFQNAIEISLRLAIGYL